MQLYDPQYVKYLAKQHKIQDDIDKEVSRAILTEVENELREIIQDAQKFQHQFKHMQLAPSDIDNALKNRGYNEETFGIDNANHLEYIYDKNKDSWVLKDQLHLLIKILLHFITASEFQLENTLEGGQSFLLRDGASRCLSMLIIKYGSKYFTLQQNVCDLLQQLLQECVELQNQQIIIQNYETIQGILQFFYYMPKKCKENKKEYATNFISTLIKVIEDSKETTMQGLIYTLKVVEDNIITLASQHKILGSRSNFTLKTLAQIFQHYIAKGLKFSSGRGMEEMKSSIIKIATDLLEYTQKSKNRLRENSLECLQNDSTILVYGYSSAVFEILSYGASQGIRFSVIVCESRPNCEGYKMVEGLEKLNIECNLIIDSALGQALEEVDMVISGAEAVVENGGIINKIGTYTVALCSKALKKPFYVASESFKFTREYPLCQKDIQDYYPQLNNNIQTDVFKTEENKEVNYDELKKKFIHPLVDYTPPELITLLFTDVGIFTPSAVSDELIQTFKL
ncbi:Histone-fold [Pseudocohnilembus persalinus]|uniref:Translation initiation factor eIF2B subunit alpha n=1 Tax=Pseudocohnilembus persalinus TaxID=266149 RepID=A0A0V0QN64_PSEPJ|nr:Histone-fold [Pseudocohnilembus persalinus]|eukprot:KRX03546.1 Histone-fold [Pseudocohnilembus persalinus]